MLILYLYDKPSDRGAVGNAARSEHSQIGNAASLIGSIYEQIGGTIAEDRNEQIANVGIQIPLLTSWASGNRRDDLAESGSATGSVLSRRLTGHRRMLAKESF
jgi:hypothetical protein